MLKSTFRRLSIFAFLLFFSPLSANAVDYNLPSLWEEYEDYFIFGTFGEWEGRQQLYHYKGNSPANALKLDSQIGNDWRNPDSNPSRKAYLEAVKKINDDASLSEAEKAAALEEANRVVVLVERPRSMEILDKIRAFNENRPQREKKMVRGHVLVWHGPQQPMYFFMNGYTYDPKNPDWASSETMLARLDNYIRLMMEKYSAYKDVIYSWDVVNEALDDYTGQIRNMDDPLKQNGQWGKVFRRTDLDSDPDKRLFEESKYVRQAFASARKWSKHYGAEWTLYFNDFQDSNKPYEPKMSQTVKMLKPIYEAGDLDGYGMQGRLSSVFPSIDLLRKQIELGLSVSNEFAFTEADIRSDFELNPAYDPGKATTPNGDSHEMNTYDADNSPVRRKPGWGRMGVEGWNRQSAAEMAIRDDIQKEQVDFAADLMDLLIEFKDKFSVLQWDGTNDNQTFNSAKGAHIWGAVQGNPEKMAFFAILGAPQRDKLKNVLASAPGEEKKTLYPSEAWDAYMAAKTTAENLLNVRIYDREGVEAVKRARTSLLQAVNGLTGENSVTEKPKRIIAKQYFESITVPAIVDTPRPPGARGPRLTAGPLDETRTETLRYWVFLPEDYEKNAEKDGSPLVLFLHGGGERGSSDAEIGKVKSIGLCRNLERPEFAKNWPGVTISPQCDSSHAWSAKQMMLLLDHIEKEYKIDKKRIYVTGLSMGGYGTWSCLNENAKRFAAAVPICGGGEPSWAEKMTDTRLWVFHGQKDPVVPVARSQEMIDAIKKAGGQKVIFTVFPEADHDSWTPTYGNQLMRDWLFSQSLD